MDKLTLVLWATGLLSARPDTIPVRYSFTYCKVNGNWLIANQQSCGNACFGVTAKRLGTFAVSRRAKPFMVA